jgi:hypothetical protein
MRAGSEDGLNFGRSQRAMVEAQLIHLALKENIFAVNRTIGMMPPQP